MQRKQRAIVALLVIVNLVISGCGFGQMFGPTATPLPTITPTSSPTPLSTPTPTPDPLFLNLDAAKQSWQSGDAQGAIAQYKTILGQSSNPGVRAGAFSGLLEVASANKSQADAQVKDVYDREIHIQACEVYKLAFSAYEPVLAAQDRPTFAANLFYTDAAGADVALIECSLWYQTPAISENEAITSLLDHLASYPDVPAIKDVFTASVLSAFQQEIINRFEKEPNQVMDDGKLISAKIGDYTMSDGQKVSEFISHTLLQKSLCAEKPISLPNVATSQTKKAFSCDASLSGALKQAGLLATDPGEIWFVITNKYSSSSDVQCTGYRTDAKTNFSYTYGGRSQESYLLKDARSGRVIATKTFLGTAPKCVFSSCSLNTFTNFATCTGGEGHSTYDEAVLIEWLKARVK